jgi:tetratricopeptide (TPR) repeat protein
MRWLQTEYLLKGIYLGLVLYAALQQASIPPESSTLAGECLLIVNLLTLGGLGAALVLAGLTKLREGFRVKGRLLPFILFLLLESPTLAYLGILGGTIGGIYLVRDRLAAALVPGQDALQQLLLPTLGGAAVAGVALGLLRQVKHRLLRLALILALAGGLVAAGLSWLGLGDIKLFASVKPYKLQNEIAFAVQLLLGIPFFYLLTFAGHEEESEVEIGAMSGLLGLGLIILLGDNKQFGLLAVILPVLLYFGYTARVLPGLRVLKHAFRGLSYTRVGRHRRALQAFRRALQLDPNNRLAREGFWEVHRSLDLQQLVNDPQTMALLDLDLCLDRAGTLLLSRPTPAQLDEAQRLLDLVVRLQPDRRPQADYWRAVAHTHAHEYDAAATELTRILDPHTYGPDHPFRKAVLLPAWQMALTLSEQLRNRVGIHQLEEPCRRMEAISAVERHLADNPDDPSVLPLKRLLYSDLTEAEYDAFAGAGQVARHVDHPLLQQLGLALINDDSRWQRGGEYLRMAARGLPALGPTLFVQIAQAQQRAGHTEEARHNYELAKRAGQSVGPKNLADAERQAYFITVKLLAEDAMARADLDAAIHDFHLYTESERSGLETLRTLAELYERKGDPLMAARVTDQGLVYNSKDKDLVERKDRYYYSILPDHLRARLESVKPWFDFDYCLRKARTILDGRYPDPEWLDVADHLTTLASIVRPDSSLAKLLHARVQLRYGERDRAVALLEEVRGPARPEKFASGEDEEAWYLACQLLGDLYLELGRADLAVACLNDFRKSSRSGAKTLYKLGQAFEALGDVARAKKCYEQVTAYDGNPLAPDAYEALQRLQG